MPKHAPIFTIHRIYYFLMCKHKYMKIQRTFHQHYNNSIYFPKLLLSIDGDPFHVQKLFLQKNILQIFHIKFKEQ